MLPALAILAAALCFSTTGTAQALAGVDASPLAVGAARIVIGGGILGLLALVRRRPTPAPTGSRLSTAALIAIGAVGVLAYQPLFFLGTRENGVAIGTVVALGSAPIATGIVDAVRSRRLPSPRWMLATAIALAGVVLVSGVTGGAVALAPAGLLASAGAGMSYALYTVCGKALIERGWDSTRVMGTVFGVAAVVSLPVLLVAGASWLGTPNGLALALWLGLVTTTVAYLLFGWGLARLSAVTVSTLTLAEPLAATLLGLLVLREQLTPVSALGLALIAVGLAVVSAPSRRRQEVPDATAPA
ncbi:DMT family transporter [Microbacterium trichothecenolyticum]|uniref:DME family drug/metabolite transporter n=1 Tax=Microbacterium trichothecenolyticum TaxID=69370 RepID=A0ABU0TU18_MICTR|nr:EamA family transporter [Microbacterium trichothecenolyticum]MDQ1123159.1 DME family drug/metabolite transporter [Microbacterium trichothecenolyticum]